MSSMTPSMQEMTDGQIDKIVDIFRARVRKGRNALSSDAVQQVLGQSELPDELFGVFQRRVEAVSSMIVRHVKVDRTRSPEQVIDATARAKYIDGKVISTMPRGEGEEKKVFFFKVSRFISDDDLEKEYDLRGLRPDPYAQAKVNEDDPSFADTHPNGTHWKDADGRWNFATFSRWDDDRRHVDVYRRGHAWRDFWWFGGVCK